MCMSRGDIGIHDLPLPSQRCAPKRRTVSTFNPHCLALRAAGHTSAPAHA